MFYLTGIFRCCKNNTQHNFQLSGDRPNIGGIWEISRNYHFYQELPTPYLLVRNLFLRQNSLTLSSTPVTDGALQSWRDSLKNLTAPEFICLIKTQYRHLCNSYFNPLSRCEALTLPEIETAKKELKLLFPGVPVSINELHLDSRVFPA